MGKTNEDAPHFPLLWMKRSNYVAFSLKRRASLVDQGGPSESHVLVAPGFRLAISGPEQAAKTSCDYLVRDLARRGVRSAACIYPKAAASTL